jgi:hypothetical protein
MRNRNGEEEEEIEKHYIYRYLWEDLENLPQFILKICFQYPVSFINNEALPKNSGM